MTTIVRYTPHTAHLGDMAVALGVFDGVHLGHQTLIRDAIANACAQGHGSCVLTFDRDPDRVVTPDRAAPQLMTLDDKLEHISALGPDVVLVIPFDDALASLEPEAFLREVLLDALRPWCVIVGEDFRFGAQAAGDVETLRLFGEREGFTVVAHELVRDGDAPVTSTRIRGLVAAGDVGTATRLLGRPHRLHGRVVHGLARGHRIGTPTANLEFDTAMALPGAGVYAARATIEGRTYAAAVSSGLPPSFPDATCVLEVHLLDFDGDLYDATMAVDFIERLRDQRAFNDEPSLAAAIEADVARVRQLLT